jgi:hypothetical protein
MPISDKVEFCYLVVGASLAIVLLVYLLFSRRTQNYVNVLTPFLLVSVPAYFVLELVNIYVRGYDGSRYAYVYIYATYTIGVIAKAVGFLAAPRLGVSLLMRMPRIRLPGLPYLLLILAFVLYAPVLIEHRELLTSPREIYALTRVGYGLESILSTFCINVGFILILFQKSATVRARILYGVIASGALYMHGSKGQVLVLLLIGLYFAAFILGRAFSIGRLVLLGTASTITVVTLFYLTFPDNLRDDLVNSIARYSSEYTRNAVLVIDDGTLDPQLGRLAFEDSFYAVIPRQLFPEKRKDFGFLWLANRYYPSRFQEERGAPAFGLGLEYADFGIFTIIYYVGCQLIAGLVAKIVVDTLRTDPNPGDFALLLMLLDVPLVPTGGSFPLPIYYAIALLMKALSSKRAPQRLSLIRHGALP